MRQAHLLRILVKEKAILRLVKTIGYAEYPTRELLRKLGAYGYGHKLLLKAQGDGLVQRIAVKNKIYNRLTVDGKKLIKLSKEIGV